MTGLDFIGALQANQIDLPIRVFVSGEPMRIPAGGLIYKEATVKGFWGSKVSQAMAVEDKRRLVGELLQRTLAGQLQLPVDGIYDLADVGQAAAASLQPARKGKVLLRV